VTKIPWKIGRIGLVVVSGMILPVPVGRAEDGGSLKGAEAVLAVLAESGDGAMVTPAAGVVDPRKQFAADLAMFASNSVSMKPAEAADAWLALVDRFHALPGLSEQGHYISYDSFMFRRSGADKGPLTKAHVYAAVPGPSAWPILEERTAVRKATAKTRLREAELRLFTLLLNGNWSVALQTLDEAVKAIPRDNDGMGSYYKEQFGQIRNAIDQLAKGQKETGTAAEFERLIDGIKEDSADQVDIMIPDLVSLVGGVEASRLIEKAALVPKVRLSVKAGPETRRILKEVVLRNPGKFKTPQWRLVEGSDSIEYFEAMDKLFPRRKQQEQETSSGAGVLSFSSLVRVNRSYRGDDGERKSATQHYLAGLLAASRLDDAVRFAMEEELDLRELTWMLKDRRGQKVPAANVFRFSKELLRKNPEAMVWGVLVNSGMAAGEDAELLKMLSAPRAVLSNADRQLERESDIADGYLALDRVDDGLALLRNILADTSSGGGERTGRDAATIRQQVMGKMVVLGCVLERQDLVDEGVQAMEKVLRAPMDSGLRNQNMNSYVWLGTLKVLADAGHFRQAEALALEILRQTVRTQGEKRGSWNRSSEEVGILIALAGIYSDAGRHADVLTLLEKVPGWGADDLVDVGARHGGGGGGILSAAAKALLAEGRHGEAVRVAKTALMLQANDDDAYQVLLAAGEPGVVEWLDALYARDRFEERPLIWKAVYLLKQGEVEKAEQAIREAIKVDPTDGETRVGYRVKSYSVLAEVLEARGKKEDAALFRNVVAAVRLAEKGDAMTEAKLLRRSLNLYDKAAVLFSDAYCVQWRLAERLYATGHPEEAEKHYAIVFERMPEQFGRVASLCFGCEGVFDRTESRTVAEKILERLATNTTVRPQVFYLLGQLREAQGRYSDAYGAFRKAVAIDPEYLDGWRQISQIAAEVAIPQSERDEVSLRMIRLDPLGKHAGTDMSRVADLKGLWNAVAANQKFAWDRPRDLFPLKASKAMLEEKRAAAKKAVGMMGGGMGGDDMEWMMYGGYYARILRPGEAVMSSALMTQLFQSFASLLR
jgi:tetratricopeptide (TPR) repeat protein